jgi:hypothetical protein
VLFALLGYIVYRAIRERGSDLWFAYRARRNGFFDLRAA